ncbi:MAG TPA: AMP-binding protein [Ktedonobacteraceae bacterium]|nr:AMP-binding protein [Ktedonobacteraceae bacterium]
MSRKESGPMKTIPQLFANAAARFAVQPALIEPGEDGAVSTLTYRELQERVQRFAGYLQQQRSKKNERLMIWSASRSDWLVAHLGALTVGMVVVPLDVNSREDFVARIAETTEARYLVTTRKQYQSLKQPPALLLDIDALPQESLDAAQLPPIEENDLAELVFTSGTTGQPKGVMLSHYNIISNAIAAVTVVDIRAEDRELSILPLSHMFEMTIQIALLHSGASIIYARTLVPDKLLKLLSSQQATCMILVPQALQLFLSGIEREVRRQNKERQWELLHRIAPFLPFRLRRYLFRSVHQRFGGHFRFFVSGGAYLAPALARRWEHMGFRMLQGYGATECSPIITATPFRDHNLETVGKPLPEVEVRIATDQEVQVRGPNVAQGYWKNPEATAAAFQNGWYNTGDLGYLDDQNHLYLKGRKKNLIVLANGMNVYPEDIENTLNSIAGVKEAVVIGLNDNDQGQVVHAVLLTDTPDNAKAIVQQANKKLASHQQIKGFTVWHEPDFPRTHTLKVKRQEVIDAIRNNNKREEA